MDAKEQTGAPPPRIPRARSAEHTRNTILRAAIAEFAAEGYGGARVDRISRAAGSNDRMLYYYFGSKETLFRCVIEQCYADLVAEENPSTSISSARSTRSPQSSPLIGTITGVIPSF